jgi:hypothetical protein
VAAYVFLTDVRRLFSSSTAVWTWTWVSFVTNSCARRRGKKRGLMRLSRGAKVLWEKFESGEEADTEIQQQRDHVVIIVQEASYRQGAVDIGEKQDSGRGDAG